MTESSAKKMEKTKETKLCQGKDVFERMNYLYQASQLLSSQTPILASSYGSVLMSCARKAVLRIEPSLKRTICKSCQSPLIPGETAKVRLKSKGKLKKKKRQSQIGWTCLVCKETHKFPTKKGHRLWAEREEAVVQLFDYNRTKETGNTKKV